MHIPGGLWTAQSTWSRGRVRERRIRLRDAVPVPVAAYNVSGEYAMVEAAAANGWIDREPAILETLTAIRRAGADVVLTYWAAEVARILAR